MDASKDFVMTQGAVRLNLGCGRDIREGWVNVDREDRPGVLALDLERDDLPFVDGSVSYVYASHILEHLLHWERLVIEVHRVLKPGGRFEILVPYGYRWNSAYHVRYFLPMTMDDFCLIDEPYAPRVSFQARPLFAKVDEHLHYKVLGRWHHVPVGRRYVIHWVLRKVEP
ncbi:MAG: methyltransferase domain-containing protein [Candidatus Pacebacteria bacterium]|nr:methyltransferase domain-containing protein [Candidatus Paceibacterota bacterium]